MAHDSSARTPPRRRADHLSADRAQAMKFASVARLLAVGGWPPSTRGRPSGVRAPRSRRSTGAILEDERSDEATPLVEGQGWARRSKPSHAQQARRGLVRGGGETVGGGGADDALLAPARGPERGAPCGAPADEARRPWRFSSEPAYATRLVPSETWWRGPRRWSRTRRRTCRRQRASCSSTGSSRRDVVHPRAPTEGAACDAPLFAGSVAAAALQKRGSAPRWCEGCSRRCANARMLHPTRAPCARRRTPPPPAPSRCPNVAKPPRFTLRTVSKRSQRSTQHLCEMRPPCVRARRGVPRWCTRCSWPRQPRTTARTPSAWIRR